MRLLPLAAISATLLMSGCATVEVNTGYLPRMTWTEVYYYRTTCKDADAKADFLETQLTRGFESLSAPDYETKIHMNDRTYNAALRGAIRELRGLALQVRRDGNTKGCPEEFGG